jgi:phasin family protein
MTNTVNVAQLVELQKSQLNTIAAVSQALFGASEKLIALNLAAAKAAFEDATQSSHALLSARDPQELLGLATSAGQPALEKFVGYSRNAYGIATGTQAELSKIIEEQISEGNKKVAEFVEMATQHAPAGSESAVSFFKTALATANTAFDTVHKASRQASDWAESNFVSATTATLNAAAAANDSVKAVKTRKSA